jgi:hypothetical protein
VKAKGGEGLAKVVDVPGEVDFSTGHNLAQEGELDFINLREPKSKSVVFGTTRDKKMYAGCPIRYLIYACVQLIFRTSIQTQEDNILANGIRSFDISHQ